MKNCKRFKAVALSVTVVMLFSLLGNAFTGSAESSNKTAALSSGWNLMAQDDNQKLYLNSDTTNFYIEDIVSGKRVYSFVDDISIDTVASGANAMEMQSAMVVTIYDMEKKTESVRNTKAVCVNNGSFDIRPQDNGFYIDYEMNSSFISFSLSVKLSDGKLVCSIPSDSIVESQPERYKITQISLLPYMIKGESGSEGQIVLPDGCGELMDFSSVRASADAYMKPIYGRDKTLTYSLETDTGYDVTTPYIAAISSDVGILSVPTEGAAIGYVNAVPAGKLSNYANAYYSFKYRASDVAVIGKISAARAQILSVMNDIKIKRDVTVEYSFLFEDATVSKLAKLYGKYLAAGSLAKKTSEHTTVFDIYGSVEQNKKYLGLFKAPAKTISNGDDILSFAENYENVVINLKNSTNQQLEGKINTTLKPINKVLNSSQIKTLNKGNNLIFINANPITFAKNSWNANSFFDASKTIYGSPAVLYGYRESTHLVDKNINKQYLFKLNKIDGIINKLSKSADKYGIYGMSSDTLGSIVYNDYSVESDLQNAVDSLKNACALFAQNSCLMLTNPGDYTYAYLNTALNIPVSSSNDDACSGEFPFLQIALGRNIEYTVEPINLYRSPETMFLKALVTGSNLHYSYVLSNSESLSGTNLNFLYSANYADFKEMTERQHKAWLEIQEKTQDSALSDYKENSDGTVTAIYENGTTVTVNFETKTYSVS